MKTSLITLGLLAALPFAASATDGLSYNHVEGGYVNTDAKGGDADGWAVKGSAAVHPNFHVFGSYSTQETNANNIDVDQWRLGVGYNRGVARNTDLLARVAYQRFDRQHLPTYNGYSAEVGVRTAFTPMIEGYALAGYEDYSKKAGYNPDGEFYGRVGALAKFNANWGVNGEVKLAKGGDREWFVGPRFTW